MKPKSALAAALVLVVVAVGWLLVPRAAEAGGTVGGGHAIDCQESALNMRLAGGGLVTFNCGPSPVDITLTSRKVITLPTIIDGGNLITLDGVHSAGLFQVQAGASLELKNIILARGANSAILSSGVLTLTNSLLRDNTCLCAGGAVHSDGALFIQSSTFSGNSANGPGSLGGAVYNLGTAVIASSTFSTRG
jgi:hypothetical protein